MSFPGEWINDGLCAQIGGEFFFPEIGGSMRLAKLICRRCTVIDQCKAYALSQDNTLKGVWGATTPTDRREIRAGRKIA